MASNNVIAGTGAALAGLGGIGVAAVVGGAHEAAMPAKPAVARVETRTVVVRTVEHRVRRLKPRHRSTRGAAAVPASRARVVSAPVSAVVAPPTAASPPIRTRASGGTGHVVASPPIRTRASGGSGNAVAPRPIRTRASGGSGHGSAGGDGEREAHDD